MRDVCIPQTSGQSADPTVENVGGDAVSSAAVSDPSARFAPESAKAKSDGAGDFADAAAGKPASTIAVSTGAVSTGAVSMGAVSTDAAVGGTAGGAAGGKVAGGNRAARPSVRELLRPGVAAVGRFWKPFVLIQGVALLMVTAYFVWPAARHAFGWLGAVKASAGLIGSALAGGFAGALLPELAKVVALGQRHFDAQRVRNVGFNFVFFMGNGLLADLFYRLQAVLFGETHHLWQTAAKVACDQFGFTPFLALPYGAIAFALRRDRYHPGPLLGQLNGRWYVSHVIPLLLPNWFFWIPMVSLVYSLPGELQYLLFLFGLAAWSLIMVFIASGESDAGPVLRHPKLPETTAPVPARVQEEGRKN